MIEFRGRTDQQTGVLLNHSPMNASVTAQHYHSDLGRKLEDMKVLVNELQAIMQTCEDGEEKEAFSTEGFVPLPCSPRTVPETPPTSEARETARIRFLQIAHELKPELVRSLYEEVLPPYHGPNPAPKREVYISNYKKVLKAWLARKGC